MPASSATMDPSQLRRYERLCKRLVQAVYAGDAAEAGQALERGAEADIYVGGDDGYPLLYVAARSADAAVCRLLMAHGVHPDVDVGAASSEPGATALMRAARHGNAAVVRVLLDGGAAADAVDLIGNTALHWAAGQGHADVVGMLIEAGADPARTGTEEGITPLIAAVWAASERVIDQLVDAGVDVNQPDEYGDTAMDHAARHEDPAIEQHLASHGGRSARPPERPVISPNGGAFIEAEIEASL